MSQLHEIVVLGQQLPPPPPPPPLELRTIKERVEGQLAPDWVWLTDLPTVRLKGRPVCDTRALHSRCTYLLRHFRQRVVLCYGRLPRASSPSYRAAVIGGRRGTHLRVRTHSVAFSFTAYEHGLAGERGEEGIGREEHNHHSTAQTNIGQLSARQSDEMFASAGSPLYAMGRGPLGSWRRWWPQGRGEGESGTCEGSPSASSIVSGGKTVCSTSVRPSLTFCSI